mmetsp:Transcript_53999/g.61475  ORF Transcript_53999/g.61475 Transcript_53999/m.61475 type:complete len:846 (+) Transcript_53999:196-2733(+)
MSTVTNEPPATRVGSDGDRKVALASASVPRMENNRNEMGSIHIIINNKSRKELIGDCALVEIIHLHDCLRGALAALEKDLTELSQIVLSPNSNYEPSSDIPEKAEEQQLQQQHHKMLSELESRATARFQVIWSVFRAHSAAEDEFIWPALRLKTQGLVKGSPCGSPCHQPNTDNYQQQQTTTGSSCADDSTFTVMNNNKITHNCTSNGYESSCDDDDIVEQEEYEEDHADEERMFTMMDHLLTRLRKGLVQMQQRNHARHHSSSSSSSNHRNGRKKNLESITNTTKEILSLVKTLNQHLMVHLEKEEKQCLPLVVKHLSKSEIHDLVGKIMGKRSCDMIAQILTMAVQNLNETDKEEMVKHMKQAMVGTFFDTWLSMSGWMDGINGAVKDGVTCTGEEPVVSLVRKRSASIAELSVTSTSSPASGESDEDKRLKSAADDDGDSYTAMAASLSQSINNPTGAITSQEDLEKLIRAVVTNQSLTPAQINTTIQGLRASVWKRNQQLMGNSIAAPEKNSSSVRGQDLLFPTAYYQKNVAGKIAVVWKHNNKEDSSSKDANRLADEFVPKFTVTELAPTFHDGTTSGDVLGCHHYARACKIRHPISGRLYTCRLCAEQDREVSPTANKDEPLDRYAITEITCMKCTSLQPAAKNCVNTDCELHKKGFAKYFCDICNLYDDRPRPIFHCPYCNTCRMGLGLGIDFRHCMRCNACVSLADKDHRCIPQKLQGSCPICHDTLFNSTEPLKGLRCGHVMHLSCYTEYCRGQNYTCPLCMRCMEDMSDYFSLLDQAVRMQAMPAAYQNTICNIYCQDCEKTGQCRYHFVGQKCPLCGSYNTREMGRYEQSTVPN